MQVGFYLVQTLFRNHGSRIRCVFAAYEELWLYTVAELIVSAIDNLKTMAGGHVVHEWQAIL